MVPTPASTIGTFQYCLLYTCPAPGTMAEYKPAFFGFGSNGVGLGIDSITESASTVVSAFALTTSGMGLVNAVSGTS